MVSLDDHRRRNTEDRARPAMSRQAQGWRMRLGYATAEPCDEASDR